MLARCKWRGDRYDALNDRIVEYGTILQFVYVGTDTCAIIAMDTPRGKLIRKDIAAVTVTTWFNWIGEGK